MTPESLAASGTEDGHQMALCCWAASQTASGVYPQLAWLFAVPSGGKRSAPTAARLKATGTKPGVPDLCLAWRVGPYAALWIELKRPKSVGKSKGTLGRDQINWIGHLQSQGHGAVVAYGWIEARDVIISYLEQKE